MNSLDEKSFISLKVVEQLNSMRKKNHLDPVFKKFWPEETLWLPWCHLCWHFCLTLNASCEKRRNHDRTFWNVQQQKKTINETKSNEEEEKNANAENFLSFQSNMYERKLNFIILRGTMRGIFYFFYGKRIQQKLLCDSLLRIKRKKKRKTDDKQSGDKKAQMTTNAK